MRRLLTLLSILLLFAGCDSKSEYTPLQQAVVDYVSKNAGEGATLTFKKIEIADSLTVGQLYEQRIRAFEVKLDQDTKYYESYKAKKMPNNMEKHLKAMGKDKTILEALHGMDISAVADEVLCYDIVFTGKAETAESIMEFEDFYAAVTPEGKVLSTNNTQKGLHKGFGKYLEGYTEILRSVGDEEEED